MQVEAAGVEMSALTLEKIVEETSDLPALPEATLAVMKESQSSTSTAHSVAKYLEQDQALTARVLRLANSAFYGMQRKICSPEEAVVVLGMRAVRNLAMIASTYHWMSKPLLGYGMEPGEFWQHSLGTAIAAQLIANTKSDSSADTAFTCGLLHDVGKLALSSWLERRAVRMSTIAAKLAVPMEVAERRILGFDHQEVGGLLVEKWNLPKAIVEVASYHHRPSECFPTSSLVDTVHLGDYVASVSAIGHGGEGIQVSCDAEALARIGADEQDLEGWCAAFEGAYNQYEKLFDDKKAA
jgi:HD-like signal output (HDOD) protein